jgi:general secretion pathway protein B
MSYILDALKKAESERERGAVPGLNSTQANQTTYIQYGSDQRPWWLVALVLGLLLALVAAVWLWRQAGVGPATQSTTPIVAPAVPSATPAIPIAAPASPTVASAPVSNPAPTPSPVVSKVDKTVPLEAAASTVAHVQAKVTPPSTNQPPAAAKAPVASAAAPVPAAVAPAAPVEPVSKPAPVSTPIRSALGGVPMLSELPEPMRRQIPALNISGAVYSDAPPEWTLIINDQLMGKGSLVAPDVRLEEITGSSAVFNFRGQRFRIDR